MSLAKPFLRCALVARLALCGLLSGVIVSDAAYAETTPQKASQSSRSYAAYIAEASQRFGIPERWIVAIMRAESAGAARVESTKGAMGLMQIMPDTWEELRVPDNAASRTIYEEFICPSAKTLHLRRLLALSGAYRLLSKVPCDRSDVDLPADEKAILVRHYSGGRTLSPLLLSACLCCADI